MADSHSIVVKEENPNVYEGEEEGPFGYSKHGNVVKLEGVTSSVTVEPRLSCLEQQGHNAHVTDEGPSVCLKRNVLHPWSRVEHFNALRKDVGFLEDEQSACAKEESDASVPVIQANGPCVSARKAKDELGDFAVKEVGSNGQVNDDKAIDKHDHITTSVREAKEGENDYERKAGLLTCLKNDDPSICFVVEPGQRSFDGEVNDPRVVCVLEESLGGNQMSNGRVTDDQFNVYVTIEDVRHVSTGEASMAAGTILKEEEGASAKKNMDDSNKGIARARKEDESHSDFMQNASVSSYCTKKEIYIRREIDAEASPRQQFSSDDCVRDNSVTITIQGPSVTRRSSMAEEVSPSEILVEETGLRNCIQEESGLSTLANKEDNLRVSAKDEVDNAYFKHDNRTVYVVIENGFSAGTKEGKEGLCASVMEQKAPCADGVDFGCSVCATEDDDHRTCATSLAITSHKPSLTGHFSMGEDTNAGALLVKETSLRTSVMEERSLRPNGMANLRACPTKESILTEKNDGSTASIVKLVDGVTSSMEVGSRCDPVKLKTYCTENPVCEADPRSGVTRDDACNSLMGSHQLRNASPVKRFSVKQKGYISEEENDSLGCCCICNDEHSWPNNLLVYCDGGPGCKVAVHQGCYGIVKVPEGPWFCRKCESQERAAKVKCELCPERCGAFKRTDTGGWAHVVCALYIPEVNFACTTTMEPILLKDVPRDRFTKVCSICHKEGRESKGACMTCNAPRCTKVFHATCAQSAGLLCAEKGAESETLKYCGYCKEHLIQLGLYAKNGKKILPQLKKAGCQRKVILPPKRGKERCKVYTDLANTEGSSLKCNEDTVWQMSAADLKTIFASDKNERMKSTTSVNKRKRKASGSALHHCYQDSEEGVVGKGKKLKRDVCSTKEEASVGRKRKLSKVTKQDSKRPKSLNGRKARVSQQLVSPMPSVASCIKGTTNVQNMPSATTTATEELNLKKFTGDNEEKSHKCKPKIGRPRNEKLTDTNGLKLVCKKVKIKKLKNADMKTENLQQPSPPVTKTVRLQNICMKGTELQKSTLAMPSIPQAMSRKGKPQSTGGVDGSHQNTAPALPKGSRKQNRVTNSVTVQKLSRKVLPCLSRTVKAQNPRVKKGVSMPSVTPNVDIGVGPKNASAKGVNVRKSPTDTTKPVESQNIVVEVTRLQKTSPSISEPAHLHNSNIHTVSLKSTPTGSKTDLVQEPIVTGNNFQMSFATKANNGNSPVLPQTPSPVSGILSGELSFKNGSCDLPNLLSHNPVTMRTFGVNRQMSYDQTFAHLSKSSIQDNMSLEQLLERQWSEGHEFLLEHSTFSDVMEILRSLNQLQIENEQLNEKIRYLAAEKERLQFMKYHLSFPFPGRTISLATSPPALSAQGALDKDLQTDTHNHQSAVPLVP
ncbi:protein AF-10-like isoform X1 [Lissotriton helveticus]